MHGPTCIFWANLTPFSLKVLPYVSYLDISRNGNMAGDRLQWIQKMGTQITLAYLKPKALLMSDNDIDADFSDVVNWLPATLEYLDISKNEFVGSVGDAVVSHGLGLGRIVAFHHHLSTSHQIREHIRCLYF
jgi:hypothetical protein